MFDLRRETLRRFVIMLFSILHFRQSRVWKHGDRKRRVFAQILEAVGHVLRSRAAVHADDVDWKWLKRRKSGADLGAVEHGPEDLDGNLSNDRDADLLI